MKIDQTICLGLLLLAITPAFAQLPEDLKRRFDEAERPPGNVVRELQCRGCTIPQTTFKKTPHNVIKGEFAKPGSTDWAVLCSVKGISAILVFWNGSEKNPAEIAKMEDRIFLQGITADEIGFSRGIAPVEKDFIMRHYTAYGGPKPPLIDHQGIDDASSKRRR